MRKLLYFLALGVLLAFGCESDQKAARTDRGDAQLTVKADEPETDEVVIPLDQVPATVLRAGEKAVPGIVFTRVERELENGVWVYDMEGTADGVEYEIEVTAEGKVLEIEKDDDAGDDDDDGDDDEDEDEDDDD